MRLKYGPYSSSRLETALCGFSFWNQYVNPDRSRERKDSLATARGSVVHEVFEKITARLKEGGNTFSEAEVRSWVAEKVNEYPASYEEVGEILDMCQKYIRRPPRVLTEDAGIELRLAVKMVVKEDGSYEFKECDYDDPEAFFRGRADILVISDDLTSALVYDHKTQPNVEEADTFQMGCYAWTIWKIHPYLTEIRTVLHFARYGSYSDPIVWTVEDLMKIEDQLLTRIEIVEARQNFDATPNKLCQYCPVMLKCPAVQEFLSIDEETGDYSVLSNNFDCLGDTQKAVKLAGLSNVLAEMNNRAKKGLREHVKEFGAVAIPGMTFEYRADIKVNWDKINKKMRPEIYEIFDKHGVDPKDFMVFSQTASVAAFTHENQALVEELSEALPKKTTTMFKGYKS